MDGVDERATGAERFTHYRYQPVPEAVALLHRIEKGEIASWSLGLGDAVDASCGGLERGNFVVIGAPNKSGKTTITVNTVVSLLREEGVRVGVVTSETDPRWYYFRMASRLTGIPTEDIRRGTADFKVLVDVVDALGDMDLYIEGTAVPTIETLQRFAAEVKPDVLIIDHFQRIDSGEAGAEAAGYKRVAQSLKEIGMERDCAVLVMSQVMYSDGWVAYKDGVWLYDHSKMRTRWTNEIQGEADKLMFWHLHPSGSSGNLIYHSLRDYPSGDYTQLHVDMSSMFIGSFADYKPKEIRIKELFGESEDEAAPDSGEVLEVAEATGTSDQRPYLLNP